MVYRFNENINIKNVLSRRHFLLGLAGVAAGCLTAGTGRAAPKTTPPNVVLLVADNLGWRDLGCYGDANATTPHLDRLAEGGVRFTNAFVTAPSCSPSRASIISGQSPHSVNVLGLTHLYPKYQMPVKVPTLPRSLREAGHRTAIDGKWHVAPFKPISAYGYRKHLNRFEINSSEAAGRFISASRDGPFYLEMNFMQTHRPAMRGRGNEFRQHPDFPVDPGSISVPPYWGLPDWPEIREDVAGYYSQAAWMDSIIGEVLDHLESEGLAGRTLVVFVSDNGPMYPGGIGACHDRGIATPLILRWPEGLPAGRVVEGLASTIDIMPTCLAAAGVEIPPAVQGTSLLPLARGDVAACHDAIFAEMTYHANYTPMRAIRTLNFKYIENLSPDPIGLDMCEGFEWAKRVAALPEQRCCVPRPPEELYDLAVDPNETTNLAQDPAHAKIKSELRRKLHKWREETGDPLPVSS